MKLLVTGGRNYDDEAAVYYALDALHAKRPITLLIEGGADGADKRCKAWAEMHGITVHTESANWKAHGRRAGPMRNAKMLTLVPDGVLALPGGIGTADMCKQALAAGLKVWKPFG